MKLNSLHDLYIEELRDLYNAESQVLKALAKMARNSTSPELRSALEGHLQQTTGQVERLERIFQRLNESPMGSTCEGMKGIIEEGEGMLDAGAPGVVCDEAIISSAQRVEHYEIAGYGTVRTFARQLGYQEDAGLLQQTLEEEGQTDKKLTSIAESRVNIEATRTA